ncbi:MAG: ribbon-helix-helix protein, CopG family [Steroidobacteraceae bacterium]
MSTTTIRLDDDLKSRIAAVAERAGKSSHAFIIDAIARTVEQAELEDRFQREADERWAGILEAGRTVSWDGLRTYLTTRAAGRPSLRRPRARKLAR